MTVTRVLLRFIHPSALHYPMASLSSQALGPRSTGQDVIEKLQVSLAGKNVLVTGASSGIGAEAARVFAKAGADRVLLLGRNVPKTQAVADAINAEMGGTAQATVIQCDLGATASVRAAAAAVVGLGIPVHILLNNAGIGFTPERRVTADGLEAQFGTNHVGHFLLTNLLTEALKAAAPARVVNVSSKAHMYAAPDLSDLNCERSYEENRSYGASKTANILHAQEVHRRLSADGVTACSLHPGVIETELWRHNSLDNKPFGANKTVAMGAATSVYCAVAPGVVGGGYYEDCGLSAPHQAYATDAALAQQLWTATEAVLESLPCDATPASSSSSSS